MAKVKLGLAVATVGLGGNLNAGIPGEGVLVIRQGVVQRGVVDGVTWPPDIFVIKAESALKYHMGAPFYITAQAQVINKDFYAGLSDAQKAVIDSHCTPEWSAKVNQGWANGEMAALEKLKGLEGHTVYTLTDEEFGKWKEAAAPLVDDVLKTASDRYGMDAKQVQAELFDRLDALVAVAALAGVAALGFGIFP